MSRPARQSPPRSAGVSPASNGLPRGWVPATLGEVVRLSPEKAEPSSDPKARYVGLEHIESGTRRILGNATAAAVRSTKNVFRPSSVLYGKLRPYLNKVAQPDFAGVCSTDILVLNPTTAILPAFLARLLGTPRFIDFAISTSAGINLPRTSYKELAPFSISIPPLAEQRRIVARLEQLEARSRRARAALQELLTKEWRRTHPDEEHGSSLVAALERAHQQAGGHKRGNAAQATEGVHDLTPADFPSSWGLTDLLNLCRPGKPITYGILMPGPDQPDGVPYVRVADFPGHEINLATVRRTTKAIDAAYARSRLSAGDLLLSIRGSVGRLATVPTELHGANITQFAVSMWGMFGLCRFLFPRLPSSARSCAASRRALPGSTRRKPRTKPQWQNWTGWINPCWRRPLPASSSPRTPATSPHPPSSPGFSLKTAVHKPQRSQRSRRKEVGGSQLKAIQNRLGTA